MIIEKLIFSKHLEKGEKVLYSVHKHWTDILSPVLAVGFFGFVIPWGFYAMGFNTTFFFWMAVIWSVLAYLRFMYVLVDWYADVWLITSMGLIAIEWRGLFSNCATRIGYEDIEGVTYDINGFWPTVLRYGDITLKVMSGNNLEMKSIARPQRAELAIARFQDQFLNKKEMQDAGNLKTLLSSMIAHHMRNK
jgi:hypothetical protein